MQAQMLSRSHGFDSELCSVFRVQALRNAEDTIAKRSEQLVLIVLRVHLFPSRTQKLSSGSSTIVCGRLHVKIDNANTKLRSRDRSFSFPYLLSVKHDLANTEPVL